MQKILFNLTQNQDIQNYHNYVQNDKFKNQKIIDTQALNDGKTLIISVEDFTTNQIINHPTFGQGQIIDANSNYVKIQFEQGIKTFSQASLLDIIC